MRVPSQRRYRRYDDDTGCILLFLGVWAVGALITLTFWVLVIIVLIKLINGTLF